MSRSVALVCDLFSSLSLDKFHQLVKELTAIGECLLVRYDRKEVSYAVIAIAIAIAIVLWLSLKFLCLAEFIQC